ncbi:DUF3108 domain-containing protein [Fulvivirga ulvae]|uniref:DUF3108 domain-containing protein n=1 Tax=Fulvivirga ulvae TaxID=2904245 RepID=UPI001F4029AC|nr:DUF3108 domain-containing protein [Fulvivirga ulvae]UII33054.1 DUF3108 domain-containing protein [Fulvivirga ulvae]
MKRVFVILIVIILSFGKGFTQCNPFYNLKEGSKWELTSYNAKDKVTGRQVNELRSLEESSNGWVATIYFQSFDKKDDLVYEKEVELECEDGIIKMDMERFIPEESLQAFKDMNMTVEVDNLEWPSDLSVGKTLDDGAITLSGDFLNMKVDVTDRRVENKEKITTPAGTFDTFKVSYNVKMKMMMSRESKAIDYIAEDVGIVRSESYNGNGKLMGYTLLTKHE